MYSRSNKDLPIQYGLIIFQSTINIYTFLRYSYEWDFLINKYYNLPFFPIYIISFLLMIILSILLCIHSTYVWKIRESDNRYWNCISLFLIYEIILLIFLGIMSIFCNSKIVNKNLYITSLTFFIPALFVGFLSLKTKIDDQFNKKIILTSIIFIINISALICQVFSYKENNTILDYPIAYLIKSLMILLSFFLYKKQKHSRYKVSIKENTSKNIIPKNIQSKITKIESPQQLYNKKYENFKNSNEEKH